jgi:hypothetical protein
MTELGAVLSLSTLTLTNMSEPPTGICKRQKDATQSQDTKSQRHTIALVDALLLSIARASNTFAQTAPKQTSATIPSSIPLSIPSVMDGQIHSMQLTPDQLKRFPYGIQQLGYHMACFLATVIPAALDKRQMLHGDQLARYQRVIAIFQPKFFAALDAPTCVARMNEFKLQGTLVERLEWTRKQLMFLINSMIFALTTIISTGDLYKVFILEWLDIDAYVPLNDITLNRKVLYQRVIEFSIPDHLDLMSNTPPFRTVYTTAIETEF